MIDLSYLVDSLNNNLKPNIIIYHILMFRSSQISCVIAQRSRKPRKPKHMEIVDTSKSLNPINW